MQNFNIERYQITEEIGQGGMGKVYKAHDPQTNRLVAIKVLHTNQISATNKKRFFREARAMAKLRHPNIVTFYNIDTDTNNNFDYIVMDFVQGKQLSKCDLNPRQTLFVIKEVAFAVDYAHSQGIIHRDLKPSNIILREDNTPLVMDFGIAKNIQDTQNITQSGDVIGTARYISPEQALGQKITATTDVYALGAILYEILTDMPVVKGNKPEQILYRVIHNEIIPLRHHNKNLARELEAICSKCLEKDVSHRYQNAKVLAEDIDRFLNGKQVSVRPDTIFKRVYRQVKRYKIVIFVVITALCLLFFAVLFMGNYHHKKIKQKIIIHVQKAQKLQTTATLVAYIEAENELSKALELVSFDSKLRKRLLKVQQKLVEKALKQKEYLLAQVIVSKIKLLGFVKSANEFSKQIQEQKQKLKKQHQSFIKRAMANINYSSNEDLLSWYVFKIVKMQKPYITKLLVYYLQTGNKWQRSLAIKALGKFGNTYTGSSQIA